MKIQNHNPNFQFSSPDDPKRPSGPPEGWDPVRDIYVPRTPHPAQFAGAGAVIGGCLGVFAAAARGVVPPVIPAAVGCLAGAGAAMVVTKAVSGKEGASNAALAGAAVIGGVFGAAAGTGAPYAGTVLGLAAAGGLAGGYGMYELGRKLLPTNP